MTSSPRQRHRAYLAWMAVCLIWGTTYLGIRVSLETMPPALMGGVRWTVAGMLLFAALLVQRVPLPSRSSWVHITVMGLLMLGLGNGGVVWAQQFVSSGLAAVLVAASPFWMVGLEALLPDGERLTTRSAIGLLVGFAGIVLLVWPDLHIGGRMANGFAVGLIALQVACAGWAAGSIYSRRVGLREHPMSSAAGQMIVGGLVLLLVGTLRGEWASLTFTPRSFGALVYLIVVGAIGGFGAYIYAIRHLPLSTVSLYAYINPVIAVFLGVLILGEPFSARMAFAAAIVFLGVAIVRWRSGTARADQRAPESERSRAVA